ncbi:MAG: DUF2794 domain-containing protein [Devosiaceae bacterium]|nr:DUF2794 domain-containing protein [Devosiaceae bacterium MH13]
MDDDSANPSDPIQLGEFRARAQSQTAPKPRGEVVTIVTSNNAPASQNGPSTVTFHRRELDQILAVYGRMVAEGEWRDYAIDHLRDKAVFSVFRRTAEVPLYMIEKDPRLARRQGAYKVIAASGHVVKRGHDLKAVLKVFDKKPKLNLV